MYSLQLKKFARGTASSLVLTGLIVTALSTSLTANADTMSSEAKTMSMDHMDMDHKQMKMTGDQDYDFAMMMRMHHVQGVKMAQKEIEKGKDPDMRAAAKKIVEAQKKEIAEFDKWLAAHSPKSK
ncbi:DUF305 domain-containing protein [Cellvibrio sp. QJXJ]|uniref:DUF305 domain-containing protein n=1 Tax=Cellvibrio sp. QJXJ TaxID=2964606 RepID=UPI0021C3C99C|nr:DUF305 domain-containing protein [Cellvibrio sp. QJXJ]UUA74956.1 DUF305 domain-containing protein [Cellvibrio sp. QJXJ]